MTALSSYFSTTLGDAEFENISLSDMLNLRGVSLHIECEWQISFSRLCDFVVPNSNAIMFKTNNCFWFFLFYFLNLHQISSILKKKMIAIPALFRKYRMWKTWLYHSLKNTVPEEPLIVNMLKTSKLMQNRHESTFIIFFHHSGRRWIWKYLP